MQCWATAAHCARAALGQLRPTEAEGAAAARRAETEQTDLMSMALRMQEEEVGFTTKEETRMLQIHSVGLRLLAQQGRSGAYHNILPLRAHAVEARI